MFIDLLMKIGKSQSRTPPRFCTFSIFANFEKSAARYEEMNNPSNNLLITYQSTY